MKLPTPKILYGLPEGNQLYCTVIHARLVAGFRAAEVTAWKCVPMKKKPKVKPVKYRSNKSK